MRFEDISEDAGFKIDSTWATGVCMADVNADGLLDIYVCASGPAEWGPLTRRNKLFMNLGGGRFKEGASDAGLADEGHSTMAYFADMDQDSDLDCFIVGHRSDFQRLRQAIVDPRFKPIPDQSNHLYINDGSGHFTDRTGEAGLASRHFGLAAAIGDLNGDGLNDIYVANDFYSPDLMMVNDPGQERGQVPHFRDIALSALGHTSYFSMGVDRADYDNDGLPDLYVLDMTPGDHRLNKENMASMAPAQFANMVANGLHHQYMVNTLQHNNGDGTWSEVAQLAGVDRTDWSWAPLFLDLDNDGWKDLFVTNGIARDISNSDFRQEVKRIAEGQGTHIPFQPILDLAPTHVPEKMVFRNLGDLRFEKVSKAWGYEAKSMSNGAAYADLDRDGDLDIVTVDVNAPVSVIANRTRENEGTGYVRIALKGEAKNPMAIGASATLWSKSGMQVCDLFPARGFQSSVEPVLHFGVPDERIDSVVIDWPDGLQTLLRSPARDRTMVVDRSTLRPRPRRDRPAPLFMEVSAGAGLEHVHHENPYDDFAIETLLPQRQSAHGPAAAVADVNGDGLEDIFVSASSGTSSVLFLQNGSGGFSKAAGQPWSRFKGSEFIGACFFDADGDKDKDLYLAAGSTELPVSDERYQDRLFTNDGRGGFSYAANALPDMRTSTSAVVADGIDEDGDLDLFVGGRNVPGAWPTPPMSHVLLNENGEFKDASATWLADLPTPGSITDAVFADVYDDKRPELLLCGEWVPLRILKSAQGKFLDISSTVLDTSLIGWWQSITAGDIDSDGDIDLVAGNLGLNNKFHPSPEHPLMVYMSDFDGTSTNDIVLAKPGDQCELPVRGRECSSGQMPFIKDKFPTYKAFANATLENIYGREPLAKAVRLKATTFASMMLVNEHGHFIAKPLPMAAQISPVNSVLIVDLNGDGRKDLLMAGNMYGAEVETVRYDAGMGLLMLGDAQNGFTPVPAKHSGISIPYDARQLLPITIGGRGPCYLAINNDGPLMLFTPRDRVGRQLVSR